MQTEQLSGDSIKLTKNQVAAIQKNIAAFQDHQQQVAEHQRQMQLIAAADKNLTDFFTSDAGLNPDDYVQYVLGEKDGEPHLILIRKPVAKSDPGPAPAPAPVKANKKARRRK